jgi:chloramphenicol 3-O-phosphotransferase
MATPGRVVLFTGPSAAGKSTIAEAWASERSARTAYFDHDQARFILRAGYVSRTAARADPSLREEGDRQWLVSVAVCEAMAETYVAWGYDFSLSAFRPPGEWMGCWKRLDLLNPLIVVLLPSLEVLIARDANRTGRAHVGEDNVRRNLRYNWSDWQTDRRALVVDNSALSVGQVVELVEAHFAQIASTN